MKGDAHAKGEAPEARYGKETGEGPRNHCGGYIAARTPVGDACQKDLVRIDGVVQAHVPEALKNTLEPPGRPPRRFTVGRRGGKEEGEGVGQRPHHTVCFGSLVGPARAGSSVEIHDKRVGGIGIDCIGSLVSEGIRTARDILKPFPKSSRLHRPRPGALYQGVPLFGIQPVVKKCIEQLLPGSNEPFRKASVQVGRWLRTGGAPEENQCAQHTFCPCSGAV